MTCILKDNTKQKYLSAHVPEEIESKPKNRDTTKSGNRFEALEESITALNDLITKQNRDNLDALYNIDMDNMSSSMRKLFQSYDDGIISANASIEAWASETQAGFEAIAQWQGTVENGTIKSISDIKATADSNAAQITALAEWKGTASETLASVQATASENKSSITSLTSWKNTTYSSDIKSLQSSIAVIEQTADENGASISQIVKAVGEDGEVTAASIVTAVNGSDSEVMISADKVDISGFVTFSSLENDGESTINGNNISLVADYNGDSISSLSFYKQRYSDDTDTLSKMFTIKTVDNETDDENMARYATVLQTFRAYEGSSRYYVALKLISKGALSFEAGSSLYAEIGTYCTIDAPENTRLVAGSTFNASCNLSGHYAANKSYVFCTDGIYYVDSSGNATCVVEV